MGDENNFWVDEVTSSFDFVNHNQTDYESFKDFSKELDERFSVLEKDRKKSQIVSALEKWDNDLPSRWKGAKLSLIKKPVVKKIIEALAHNKRGSFFLSGSSGAGKTFVGYALVRRFIGKGVATPSEIKMVSESVLLNWSRLGFQGAKMIEDLLDQKYVLYVFDGIGTLDDKEVEKVAPLWEQIIDHIYSKDLVAVFTSSDDLSRFCEAFSPSGETKLRTLVKDRDFVVEPDGSKAVKN